MIIGVETVPLQSALCKVAGIPVHYLPQPVEPSTDHGPPTSDRRSSIAITMACYGAARHEKGSDLLQSAIALYLETHPKSRAKFTIQWVEDFNDENGKDGDQVAKLGEERSREFISHYFRDGEYDQRLLQTSVMLLPYRLSSYRLRGSRVVIEAMVNGIPVVATCGTTLAEQAEKFGWVVLCEDENIYSLVTALETMERNYESLVAKARERQPLAQ